MKKSTTYWMKRPLKKLTLLTIVLLGLGIYLGCVDSEQKAPAANVLLQQPSEMTVTVSWKVPLELADPSNLEQAAMFAWNEFIALTWPAMAQGPDSFPRGQPLTSAAYGGPGPTGQVVWETFRHKVEAFPGQGDPNGYNPNAPDFGFSARPDYVYPAGRGVPANGRVLPVNKNVDPNKLPPYNNLDEVTQITLNTMYAGVTGGGQSAGNGTNVRQKILFQAKVNESQYRYVAKNKFYQSETGTVSNIIFNSGAYAVTGDSVSYPPPYTNLPASNPATGDVGTIEIKAAWRRLDPQKEDVSKFYTARVRYYSGTYFPKGDSTIIQGYIDSDDPGVNETWGLVALHIIRKLPNAPAFVYATFSHYNNILDAEGNSVEDVDGTTHPQYLNRPPFTPAMTIEDSYAPDHQQMVYADSGTVNTNTAQLYFQNAAGMEAITDRRTGRPYSGPVNVNRRVYPIPPTIVSVNQKAHAAIKAANPNAVWLNYKLINVQAEPLDFLRDSARIANGLAPTFFLANEVVETNPSLQHFAGGLLTDGNITNYVYNPYTNQKNEYDYNVNIRGAGPAQQFNMGGCMGCHGSQGQKVGGDFSVLLARGRVTRPDVVQLDERTPGITKALSNAYITTAQIKRRAGK